MTTKTGRMHVRGPEFYLDSSPRRNRSWVEKEFIDTDLSKVEERIITYYLNEADKLPDLDAAMQAVYDQLEANLNTGKHFVAMDLSTEPITMNPEDYGAIYVPRRGGPGKSRGPKGGAAQRKAKRRKANKAARKARKR